MVPTFYKLNDDKTISPFVSVEAFAEYLRLQSPLEHLQRRIVGQHNIKDVVVFTIFTEVAFPDLKDEHAPFLFETRIVGGRHDGYRFRYKTWDDAMMGHQRIVSKITSGLDTEGLLDE